MDTRERMQSKPGTRIGVLTQHEIVLHEVFADGKRVLRSVLLPGNGDDAEELLSFLWQTELSVVWVMPETRWSKILTRSWFCSMENQWVVLVRSTPEEAERPLSVLLWPKAERRRGTRQLVFAFPQAAGWGWQLRDATSLLATVTYVERVLGHSVNDGPEVLAHQLLTELTLQEASQPIGQTHSWPETSLVSFHEISQPEISWGRSLTRAEQRQKYLHRYDHLSYPLQACLHLPLPAGTPEHSVSGRAYDGSRPGWWRVRVERAGSLFDGKQLPACLEQEWMSTAEMQCCRQLGYQVQVCEGYFWPQAQPSLQPWARALWQAAEQAHAPSQLFKHVEGRTNVTSSIALLARLGMAHIRERRPTWWMQINGGGRAVLFAHLARLVKRGTMPLLINGNAFWVVSDDPHPLTAAPGICDSRPWSGYHVGYSVPLPLSRAVRDILREAGSPGEAATALDALANEEASSI